MSQFDTMNEQKQMQMLMSQLQDSNLRQSVMQYINQTANGLDKDMNDLDRNKALIETLARESVHNQKTSSVWKSRTKKSVAAGVVAVVLAITVQFLVNYLTNELSKESHVSKEGAMVSTDGKVVKTQMEEMKVAADGKLVSRNGESTVKTTPSLAKVSLASSLPDSTLMGLDEIVVYSDKGYTLQIKVHGFSRVPVLNSRCGNIVHFYTAWKGKVTLDSTDLSFDEATAAEFKNAGFSLAVGGRRLAGSSTLAGFFKSVEELKASGKWTCADVPLPSMSETFVQKKTVYKPCPGSSCDSTYGGMVYGAGVLSKSHALAAATKTAAVKALLKSSSPELMFAKTTAAIWNSASFRIETSEFAQHPGQKLVTVVQHSDNQKVTFQLAAGNRSHCKTEVDGGAKTMQKAQKDSKVDSTMHFEFLGTVEEEGTVLRHFRMMPSASFVTYMAGADAKTDSVSEFWDVAETLKPYRFLGSDGSLSVIDSLQQSCSDDDLQSAVQTMTGDKAAALFSCSAAEADDSQRPTMTSPLNDLDIADANYYRETAEGDFLAYLDRVESQTAMADVCYEKCKSVVDEVTAVMKQNGDLCQGSLKAALACLEESRLSTCQSSPFVSNHHGDCNTTQTRQLEEEEEMTPTLLLNSSELVAASKSKQLMSLNCNSKMGRTTWMGDGWCMAWEFKRFGFGLTIKWGNIGGAIGLAMSCVACVPVLLVFKIPPPLYARFCIGGSISVSFAWACPQIPLDISGSCFWNFSLGADFGFVDITFASLEMGISAGIAWNKVAVWCWWVHNDGWRRRRRWWTRRRRRWRRCWYRMTCDVYVKGYIELTIAIAKARVEYIYWVKGRRIDVVIKILIYEFWLAWWGGWREVYSTLLCRYWF